MFLPSIFAMNAGRRNPPFGLRHVRYPVTRHVSPYVRMVTRRLELGQGEAFTSEPLSMGKIAFEVLNRARPIPRSQSVRVPCPTGGMRRRGRVSLSYKTSPPSAVTIALRSSLQRREVQ